MGKCFLQSTEMFMFAYIYPLILFSFLLWPSIYKPEQGRGGGLCGERLQFLKQLQSRKGVCLLAVKQLVAQEQVLLSMTGRNPLNSPVTLPPLDNPWPPRTLGRPPRSPGYYLAFWSPPGPLEHLLPRNPLFPEVKTSGRRDSHLQFTWKTE